MSMAWMYLLIAGVFEWGWPVGLKLGITDKGYSWPWLALAIASILLSGLFLMMAQKEIPIGTAYAVWTGIGAVGTFIIGIIVFGDAATLARIFFITLIVTGIVGLKLVSK